MTQAPWRRSKPPIQPSGAGGGPDWDSASPARTVRVRDGRFWTQPAYFLCILIGIALNMFAGNWGLLGMPLPLDRLLVVGGLVLAFLDPNTHFRKRLRWRPIHWLMVAYAGYAIYSAMAAGTLAQTEGFYALLDRILVPFILFSLGAVIFDTPERRDLLLKMLTLVGIYLGATAFFEIIGPHALVFPRYIMNPYVGMLFGRARGPFVTAEADGMVMAMAMFAAGVLYARTTSNVWRWLCRVAIVLAGLGGVLSLTRSIWLGMVLSVLVVMYLVPAIRRPIIQLGVAAVTLGALVFLLVAPAREMFLSRLTTERSVNDRQNTNAAAVRIIESQPLSGVGWHKFLDVGPNWVRQADTYPITNVNIEIHDVFLSRAAELGVPAAILFVLILLAGPFRSMFYRQRGDMASFRILCVTAFIICLVPSFSSPNPYPMPNFLMWLLGGIAAHRYLLKEHEQLQT